MSRVAVVGGGSWGTALAIHAARVGQQAATAIAAAGPTEKSAIAWAASDLIAAAAEATRNPSAAIHSVAARHNARVHTPFIDMVAPPGLE